MANQTDGELATCACGAVGGIVERSPVLDAGVWLVIGHENGDRHKVETFWNGEAWRFRRVGK